MTDTNQASEDETIKSKVDWSTPYDEWLIPILNRFRYGGAIECRAIPSEIQLNIESVIRTEKQELLDEVQRKILVETAIMSETLVVGVGDIKSAIQKEKEKL